MWVNYGQIVFFSNISKPRVLDLVHAYRRFVCKWMNSYSIDFWRQTCLEKKIEIKRFNLGKYQLSTEKINCTSKWCVFLFGISIRVFFVLQIFHEPIRWNRQSKIQITHSLTLDIQPKAKYWSETDLYQFKKKKALFYVRSNSFFLSFTFLPFSNIAISSGMILLPLIINIRSYH